MVCHQKRKTRGLRMKLKYLVTSMLLPLFAYVMLAVPAHSDTVIDFSGGGSTAGTISYAGGAAPLIGSNILISLVTGINTPANVGGHAVGSGVLSFTSGAFDHFDAGSGTYFWGPGGSLSIVGTVADAGINSVTTLLSAVSIAVRYLAGGISIAITSGSDTKNEDLVAYFGLPANTLWAFGGSVLTDIPVSNGQGGFTATAGGSTDIRNTVVPEPGSLMLLGSGLLGLASLARKKLMKS
jgi:hypothetical protein